MRCKILILGIVFSFLSGKVFSQTEFTDTLIVDVSALYMKTDTGSAETALLHFNIVINSLQNLDSLKLCFLDTDNQTAGTGESYIVKHHPKGFYYLESQSQQKITLISNTAEYVFKKSKTEYNNYKKLRVTSVTINGISKAMDYYIPKL